MPNKDLKLLNETSDISVTKISINNIAQLL